MAAVTCSTSTSGDFVLSLDGVAYDCVSDSPPFVLVGQGGMSESDFYTLWPALVGLMVAGYIVKRLLAAF